MRTIVSLLIIFLVSPASSAQAKKQFDLDGVWQAWDGAQYRIRGHNLFVMTGAKAGELLFGDQRNREISIITRSWRDDQVVSQSSDMMVGKTPQGQTTWWIKIDKKKNKMSIPADAVEWNGHYYKLFTDKAHFPKAAHHCATLGGHLIRIDSADENKFARKFASQGGVTTMWIDGTDSWADEGDWRYSNGQKMNYSNWPNHEPDGGKIENRVAMWENALWYADLGELWDLAYICEWDGPAGSTQRAKKIPADAVKYKGNYYKAYDEGMPHSVAQKRCEMMGGHLARIQNSGEQNFLSSIVGQGKREAYWLDGSDATKEGWSPTTKP